jgi:hypothetical protein
VIRVRFLGQKSLFQGDLVEDGVGCAGFALKKFFTSKRKEANRDPFCMRFACSFQVLASIFRNYSLISVYIVQGLYEHCLTFLNLQELDLYCMSLGMSWPPLEASSGGLPAVLKVGSRSKICHTFPIIFLHKCLCFLFVIVSNDWQNYRSFLYVITS